MDELYVKLKQLRTLADGLERIHEGTTIGSLTGGVIGAAGGITSIVGLILAPFTLGASLIVTGVGVGVGTLGGFTAGASNITNIVNQSIDQKAVHSIIKEFQQKISAMVTWLLEISISLQTIRDQFPQTSEIDNNVRNRNLKRLGFFAGKGLGGIAELIRLANVLTIGKVAAQTSKVVRATEVVTGVLSSFFVILDLIFIVMDAKEIHHIKQAREVERSAQDSVSTSDQTPLLTSSGDQSGLDQTTKVKSKIMKYIQSVRKAADELEKVLDELQAMMLTTPSFNEENDVELQNMEVM